MILVRGMDLEKFHEIDRKVNDLRRDSSQQVFLSCPPEK